MPDRGTMSVIFRKIMWLEGMRERKTETDAKAIRLDEVEIV